MASRRQAHAAVIIGVAIAIGASWSPAAGQVARDFYYHASYQVDVDIYLDTIGIHAAPSVDLDDLSAVLSTTYLLSFVRVLQDGLRLYALPAPTTREAIFRLAARIQAEQQATFAIQAGPLLRLGGGGFLMAAPNQLIVQFSPSLSTHQIDSINAANGVRVMARTPFKLNHFLLQIDTTQQRDVLVMAQLYHGSPLIDYAYPNFLGGGPPAGRFPPDPLLSDQWHLHNAGANGGTVGADIQAVGAWTIEKGESSVVIAIIEPGGFEVTHPDIEPNLWDNPGEMGADEDGNDFTGDRHGWNFGPCGIGPSVTNVTDPGLTMPCGSPTLAVASMAHGTAVAGLAAARGGNGTGVSGVCQQCSLMLVRTSMSTYAKYLAFLYAASEGADVINASWTQTAATPIQWAIEEAALTSPNGIPIVFAANDQMGTDVNECTGASPTFASLALVIAVSWTDNTDTRVSPSGYGSCIDVVAPGAITGGDAGITTTDVTGNAGWNDATPQPGCPIADLSGNRDYTLCFGGSSAAAPIVAGTIGLMLSHNPSLTRDAIVSTLRATAETVGSGVVYSGGFNEYYGYGRVNAYCALGGTGPRCPEAPKDKKPIVKVVIEGEEKVEIGARIGLFSVLDGGAGDQTIANLPGGGPLAFPTLYVSWFPAFLMTDLQLGGRNVSTDGGATEREAVAALHAGPRLDPFYFGINVAGSLRDIGSGTDTDWALGGAFGLRFVPMTHLAIRFEVRYRHWFDQSLNEFGLAFGFGALAY